MKNIHILPTDKPSRLLKNTQYTTFWLRTDFLDREVKRGVEELQYQNIYITNDEEIKVNDAVIDLETNDIFISKGKMLCNDFIKKIILTTDQDLIKDGVQTIPDEFLEWFIKNPSCEFVETKRTFEGNSFVHIGKTPSKNERLHGCYDNGKQIIGKWKELYSYKIIIPQEEPKQETLEEAAIKFSKSISNIKPFYRENTKNTFIEGAKWQQEQDKNKFSALETAISLLKQTTEFEVLDSWKQKIRELEQIKNK